MSKAFTREIDDAPEPPARHLSAVLPLGTKNYFTARGSQNLRRELDKLSTEPASPQVRQRILEFQQMLQSAIIVEPPPRPWTQVLFGATVCVQKPPGEKVNYRIVGFHETDLENNCINWLSPVAKALLKKHIGDQVRFNTPEGEQNWRITGLSYDEGD